MLSLPSSFLDFLKKRDMNIVGAQQPSGVGFGGFGMTMPTADQPAMDTPEFSPSTWSSGSPAGDDGGIMGGGDSLAKGVGGLSKSQVSGGMMAAKGLGDAVNAFTGADAKPIQAPRIDDNTSGVRQQASQMMQQLMQKKPRGLI